MHDCVLDNAICLRPPILCLLKHSLQGCGDRLGSSWSMCHPASCGGLNQKALCRQGCLHSAQCEGEIAAHLLLKHLLFRSVRHAYSHNL